MIHVPQSVFIFFTVWEVRERYIDRNYYYNINPGYTWQTLSMSSSSMDKSMPNNLNRKLVGLNDCYCQIVQTHVRGIAFGSQSFHLQ